MSLTSCLTKATALSPENRAAIFAAARDLRKSGIEESAASKQAVDDLIAKVEAAIAKEVASPTVQAAPKLKVYKTRKGAESAKSGNTQRIKKVEGGFILRDATDKEMEAAERAGRRLASGGGVDVERDSLLTALAKLGGIAMSERADTIGEGNRNIAGKMLFTKNGKAIDLLAIEDMRDYGYVPLREAERDGGSTWLRDAIKSEFMGSATHFSEQGTEWMTEGQPDTDTMTDDELEELSAYDLEQSGYTRASPDMQAITEQLLAEAEALGVDTEAIREDAARLTEGRKADDYESAVQEAIRPAIAQARQDAERRNAGAARGSDQDRGQTTDRQGEEASEGLTLEAQTGADLKAKTDREAASIAADAAEQKRLANKTAADAQRGEFTLTGSDRTVDVGAAAGQNGLFDAPGATESAQSAAPAPAAEPGKAARLTDAGEELIRNRRGKLKGLAWDDVSAMNDTLKVAQVVKANVWPRPDYAKMVDDGAPAWKAAALKAVYDKLAAAPVTRAAPTDADLRAYIETMQQVRETLTAELDRVAALPDGAELWKTLKASNVFGKVFPIPADARPVYGAPSPFDRVSEQGKENNRRAFLIGGNAAVQALQFNYKITSKVKDLLADGFPAKQESWQKSWEVRQTDTRDSDVPEAERTGQPQQRFYVYEKGSRWRLAKGGQDGGYATQEQAEAFARSLTAKKRDVLPPSRGLDLAAASRTGPDWRDGKDVTAEQVMAHFGFRGVNLGEYVKAKQGVAQLHLNHVYDAFSDLADLLGVPPKAMSLNGALGVAIGAQGSGKALAHFVPGVNEINITRDAGAGALAHEFGHAMDHYFATQHGRAASMAKRPYLSAVVEGLNDTGGVRAEVIGAMRAVMKTLNSRPMNEAEARKYLTDQRELNQRHLDRWVKEFSGNKGADPAALAVVADKLKRGDIGEAQDTDVEANLSEFMRAAGLKPGNAIAGNAFSVAYRLRDLADEAQFLASHIPQVDTDYAKASAAMDAKKSAGEGYWATPWEKFARAFETFAMDSLKDRQRESLYLSGLVDGAEWQSWASETGKAIPYPAGSERLEMQQAFQVLVDTIQTRTDEAGNVAMFSRADRTPEANTLRVLSENDDLFALPMATADTVAGVAAEIDPQIKVKQMARIGIRTDYMLTMPDGTTARLIVREPNPYGTSVYGFTTVDGENQDMQTERPGENPDDVEPTGDVWVDVSLLEAGGGGSKVYAIAAGFAHNTGRIFIGDPAGLSPDAMRRRSENMLSSALRYGTTAHLAPHPEQVRGNAKIGVPPLKWIYGDDAGNIRRLVDLNVKALENAFPSALKIDFDATTGEFRNADTGRSVSRDAIKRAAEQRRSGGRLAGPEAPRNAGSQSALRLAAAGGRTIARGAVWRALLRESGREGAQPGGRNELLVELAGLGSYAGSTLKGLFSRNGGPAGVHMADAKAIVEAIRAANPAAPTIHVHETLAQAPKALRDAINKAGAQGDVEAAFHEGEIHVFPSHMASVERMAFVVGHHEIRHYGLRSILGPRLGPVALSLWTTNPALRAAAQKVIDDGHATSRVLAIEEALADMPVAALEKLTGWGKVVAAIRQWLRGVAQRLRDARFPALADAFEPARWTDNDVAALVSRAEGVSKGGPSAYRAGGTAFGRAADPDAIKAAQALNDALVKYGLGAEWTNAYEAVALPDALSGIRQAFQAAFGRDVRPVAPTAAKFDIFNGVYIPSQPNALYVNVASKPNFVSIAGHELWHAIRRTRPELIEWYRSVAAPYYKNFPEYQSKLNALLQPGEAPYSADKALEELEADFLGDSLADGEFLQALADASPTKFRKFMLAVRAWLAGVASKIAGLGSKEYVTDIKALQEHLRVVMVAYAEGNPLPSARGRGAAFSRKYDPMVNSTGNDAGRPAKNTKAEIDAAHYARARIQANDGVASPDDLAAMLRVPGYSQRARTAIAGNVDAATRLRAALAAIDPGSYSRGQVNQQGAIDISASTLARYTPEKIDALTALADEFDVPIVVRGNFGDMNESLFQAKRMQADGFVAYTGITEPNNRKAEGMIQYIRPGGDIGRNTPLFSRAPTTAAAPSQLAEALTNLRAAKLPAGYIVNDLITSHGKLPWWHKSVGSMHNLAERNPLFKPVYDAAQDFLNDVSTFATEAADLAPRMLPKLEGLRDIGKAPLSAADTKAISDSIFQGTLNWTRDANGQPVEEDDPAKAGIVWTDGELRDRFNMDAAQIGLYREFRKATDKSLTDLGISDMLRYAGKDAEPVASAALATGNVHQAARLIQDRLDDLAQMAGPERAKILGDTAATVYKKANQIAGLILRGYAPLTRFGNYTLDVTENGERVYFGLFETEREANAFARRMKDAYPQASFTQGTLSQQAYKLFAGVSPETVELFGNMLGLESQGNEASDQVFQEYLKLAKGNRSAMKRLIHRKGIAGFSEDAGRVLAGFVYSNARQAAKNLHFSKITSATQAIADVKGQGQLLDSAVSLHQYITNPVEEAQKFKGLLFAQFLGGSLAAGLVNLTQTAMVTFPYLTQFGGVAKAAGQMKSAMADAMKWETGKKTTGDTVLDAAIKKAEEDGIISPQEVHSLIAQAGGGGALKAGDGTKVGDLAAKGSNFASKLMLLWGRPFALAEQFNRRVTYIAAYRTAVEQGMPDPAAFAEKTVVDTQFSYAKANRPQWARGAIGSTLFTFKTYSISYVELLSRMAKSGPEGRQAALVGLGMLFLASGLQGLPGADDLDDLIDGLLQRMGYNVNTKLAKREFFAGIFGEGGARFIMSGASGLPGVPIDVAGRLGLGNLIPGTGLFTKKADHTLDVLELAGPAGGFAKQVFTAADKVSQGEIMGAGQALLPVAAANAVKAIDMASTGMYRDTRGRKVIDTDGIDATMKAIGFQPNDVARVQNATRDVQEMVGLNKMREAEIADKWARGIFEQNPKLAEEARAELARWNDNNPTSRISIGTAQLLKRIQSMRQDKITRITKTTPAEMRATVRRELEGSQP